MVNIFSWGFPGFFFKFCTVQISEAKRGIGKPLLGKSGSQAGGVCENLADGLKVSWCRCVQPCPCRPTPGVNENPSLDSVKRFG